MLKININIPLIGGKLVIRKMHANLRVFRVVLDFPCVDMREVVTCKGKLLVFHARR